jgi:hypothetical protein
VILLGDLWTLISSLICAPVLLVSCPDVLIMIICVVTD